MNASFSQFLSLDIRSSFLSLPLHNLRIKAHIHAASTRLYNGLCFIDKDVLCNLLFPLKDHLDISPIVLCLYQQKLHLILLVTSRRDISMYNLHANKRKPLHLPSFSTNCFGNKAFIRRSCNSEVCDTNTQTRNGETRIIKCRTSNLVISIS